MPCGLSANGGSVLLDSSAPSPRSSPEPSLALTQRRPSCMPLSSTRPSPCSATSRSGRLLQVHPRRPSAAANRLHDRPVLRAALRRSPSALAPRACRFCPHSVPGLSSLILEAFELTLCPGQDACSYYGRCCVSCLTGPFSHRHCALGLTSLLLPVAQVWPLASFWSPSDFSLGHRSPSARFHFASAEVEARCLPGLLARRQYLAVLGAVFQAWPSRSWTCLRPQLLAFWRRADPGSPPTAQPVGLACVA